MTCQCPTTHLKKVLRIVDCDSGAGGDQCARGFRSAASSLLDEGGVFVGDIVDVQLADGIEKNVRRRDEVRPQLAKGGKNKIRASIAEAALTRQSRP